jgi:hypothetical protein
MEPLLLVLDDLQQAHKDFQGAYVIHLRIVDQRLDRLPL